MYTDEYLARHKKHTCHDENKYSKCGEMNYNTPNTCCPYMHMCPLMQHQNASCEYPMMQAPKFSTSIKNNLNYREEEPENLFRHPFGHMSYYYDDDFNHHNSDHNDEHHNDHDNYHHHSSDYYEYEPYEYYQNPYNYQLPYVQYPILPQFEYFEEDEE